MASQSTLRHSADPIANLYQQYMKLFRDRLKGTRIGLSLCCPCSLCFIKGQMSVPPRSAQDW
ncbi:uncharacterized protein LY89DRAFT_691004 [Mollisia scopiformis]|uniref:Uncharacterized protein n=1 Tax=Mollisia scopiformis TaxID=149040 RepID=A0A132B878_MOLSC|nr:uncharacterized protein LY89DRAFT_691004 [Mollisia scopiformis]KUJ08571.1 hypothetical protein LY89DRAFT_691004 [Mollisia scopiformis]